MLGGVLTLGSFRSTLIAVRSLGRAGYAVTAGLERRSFLAHSRYVRRVWRHGDIHRDEGLARAVIDYLAQHAAIRYVFPTGDTSTALVARHYEQIRRYAVPIMPPPQVALGCLDKGKLYAVAAAAGVTAPRTLSAANMEELRGCAREIGYPCIIKPNDSMGEFFGLKALICRDERDLLAGLPAWPPGNRPLLVQQFIRGQRINCDVVALDGNIMAMVQSRIYRTQRLDCTGLAVDAASMPPESCLLDRCQRLTAALGYTGVGLIQFLRDGEGAEPVLLEINPRLGAYITLACHLGHDLPLLALQCARWLAGRGDRPAAWPNAYPAGRRLHWLSGDVIGLKDARTFGHGTARDRRRWLWQIVRATCRRNVPMTWSLRDPLPSLWQCADFFTQPLRRRLSEMARRRRQRAAMASAPRLYQPAQGR